MGAALTKMHISYGKYDGGTCVIRQLNERGLLGPDLLLSHCNTLQTDEIDAVRKNDVGISSTPDTELQMGMSYPVGFQVTDRDCRCGLGVDVCCSTPADIFQQMRLQLQVQRHLDQFSVPGIPLRIARTCAQVLEMATMGGARAVGLENIVGSITPGKKADLILTRCDSPRLVPVHDPVGALVLYATPADIDTVFINGELVKSDYKLFHVDWPKLREELRASADAIMARASEAPQARDAAVDFFKKQFAA